ncbi:MAG: hypothetical protein OEZ20_10105 [candidate division WOR-3 bacterium]|nr:hypothetical protein [candidate division WOR-3 bacterium]
MGYRSGDESKRIADKEAIVGLGQEILYGVLCHRLPNVEARIVIKTK